MECKIRYHSLVVDLADQTQSRLLGANTLMVSLTRRRQGFSDSLFRVVL